MTRNGGWLAPNWDSNSVINCWVSWWGFSDTAGSAPNSKLTSKTQERKVVTFHNGTYCTMSYPLAEILHLPHWELVVMDKPPNSQSMLTNFLFEQQLLTFQRWVQSLYCYHCFLCWSAGLRMVGVVWKVRVWKLVLYLPSRSEHPGQPLQGSNGGSWGAPISYFHLLYQLFPMANTGHIWQTR